MKPELRDVKIAVLAGGSSGEREVSLRSGNNVLKALKRLGYQAFLLDPAESKISKSAVDLAFVALHGKGGEDGEIQTLLESESIPYTGSGIEASQIGMNKRLTKEVIKKSGLPCALDWEARFPQENISFPCVLKPTSDGSSLGVDVIDDAAALTWRLEEIKGREHEYFIEEFISGQEITVGVLESKNGFIELPILELVPKNRFYDYHAKYTAGMTDFICPARLSESISKKAQDIAMLLHQKIGCRGFSRVDMIVCPKRGPIILEINTIPGLTDTSDIPAQAKAAGISFEALIEIILESAI